MRTFGEEITRLREMSRYPHIEAFAEHAGVSRRGSSYIEGNQRLPSVATVEKLIGAAQVSRFVAERLRRLRAQAQAERDGFSVPKRDAHQLPRLTQRLTSELAFFMRRRCVHIGQRDIQWLHQCIDQVVKDVMDPQVADA